MRRADEGVFGVKQLMGWMDFDVSQWVVQVGGKVSQSISNPKTKTYYILERASGKVRRMNFVCVRHRLVVGPQTRLASLLRLAIDDWSPSLLLLSIFLQE